MIIAVEMFRPPFLRLVLLVAFAALVTGCGSTVQEDTTLTVHMGPGLDKRVVEGAFAALEDAGEEAAGAEVRMKVPGEVTAVKAGGGREPAGWIQAQIGEAARDATQDSTAIAYIGEDTSAATRISAPITNEAGLLQIAPGPVDDELLAVPGGNDVPADVQTTGERTLGALSESGSSYDLGYAAMSAILQAIDEAEDPLDRADVIDAYLANADAKGVLIAPQP